MLAWILFAVLLLALLGMKIATSPPFMIIGRLFASWAERYERGGELW